MEAVNDRKGRRKAHSFGSVIDELKEEINRLVDSTKIQYIGWVESKVVINILLHLIGSFLKAFNLGASSRFEYL